MRNPHTLPFKPIRWAGLLIKIKRIIQIGKELAYLEFFVSL